MKATLNFFSFASSAASLYCIFYGIIDYATFFAVMSISFRLDAREVE